LKYKETLEARDLRALLGLEKSIHSLFLLSGWDRGRYAIQDLRTEESHHVSEHHAIPGLHRGDILDARIVTLGEEPTLSDAVWVHPSDSVPFIAGEAKKRRAGDIETWRSFLFDLAYMKLKGERYAHVETDKIYDWNMFQRDRAETERRSLDTPAGGG
jgi:hypothetical protein